MYRLFTFSMIAMLPYAAHAEITSLEDALAAAYLHDPKLQAAQAELRATDEQVSQALSNYRPNVSATAERGREAQRISNGSIESGAGNLSPRDASVNITQPIFRGFRTQGSVDSADATVKSGRAKLQSSEQQLMLDASKAYMDVLQAQEMVAIQRENEADIQKQLEITQKRYKVGELTKTDVHQAQSRLSAASVARMQAETDLANQRTTFARIVGQMPGTLEPPVGALVHPADQEEAQSMAFDQNPDVVAARYTKEAAKQDIKVAEGALLPEVDLVGSLTRSEEQSIFEPQPQRSKSLMAKVSVPLYDSGVAYSKTRAAKQTWSQRTLELDDARNKAKENASNAWQTWQNARQAIAGDKDAVRSSNEALMGVKKEALVGTRTTLDILNAEQELRDARVTLVKAQHDERIAQMQVKASIGELTAQAMNLPVESYDPTRNYNKVRNQWVGLAVDE
jgi:outer membrane protein